MDPTPEEFWKHVIPNIDGDKSRLGDRLGVIYTPNHVFYFDRTEMEHATCYYQFVRKIRESSPDHILPATVDKKGFSYIIRPAYYTFEALNCMGYNDAVPDKKKKEGHVAAFLRQGGTKQIEALIASHPHLQELRNRKPMGYNIKVDYTEGLR